MLFFWDSFFSCLNHSHIQRYTAHLVPFKTPLFFFGKTLLWDGYSVWDIEYTPSVLSSFLLPSLLSITPFPSFLHRPPPFHHSLSSPRNNQTHLLSSTHTKYSPSSARSGSSNRRTQGAQTGVGMCRSCAWPRLSRAAWCTYVRPVRGTQQGTDGMGPFFYMHFIYITLTCREIELHLYVNKLIVLVSWCSVLGPYFVIPAFPPVFIFDPSFPESPTTSIQITYLSVLSACLSICLSTPLYLSLNSLHFSLFEAHGCLEWSEWHWSITDQDENILVRWRKWRRRKGNIRWCLTAIS